MLGGEHLGEHGWWKQVRGRRRRREAEGHGYFDVDREIVFPGDALTFKNIEALRLNWNRSEINHFLVTKQKP